MGISLSVEQLFGQARGLLSANQSARAARLLEQILRTHPEHLGAQQYLAMIYLNDGRADGAERLMRSACKQNPNTPEFHNNLGLSLHALKKYNEAIEEFRTAIALRNNYHLAYNNMGNALAELGRHQDALDAFNEALVINPEYVEAIANRGLALRGLKRDAEAIYAFELALERAPTFTPAHLNLARALAATDQMAGALAHYEIFLKFVPNAPDVWTEFGDAAKVAGREQLAITAYTKASKLEPNNIDTQEKLAVALEEVGRTEEARKLFRDILVKAPDRVSTYLNLLHCETIGADDPVLSALLAMGETADNLKTDERICLHFALGKAWANAGHQELSFAHYLEGNALKRSQIKFDEPKRLRVFERVKEIFTPELMRKLAGSSCEDSTPIFIVGMPRSGSTLVEQILASHPQVIGFGEREEFRDSVRNIARSEPYPEFVPNLQPEMLSRLGEDYLFRIRKKCDLAGETAPVTPAIRLTDKMPANFRYVGLIHLALPNARIIHTRRDRIDTCLSCFTQLFAENHQPFTYDLGELGRYFRAYEQLMDHWRQVLPREVMLEIHYEDLIENFERESRKLIAHCGLDWDDTCLEFYKATRAVKTASSVQVRQPLYRSSIRRWRPSDAQLSPLLQALEGGPNTRRALQ